MRRRQAAIFLGAGIVFVLVFGALYLFDSHAIKTLIPQIFFPIGVVLMVIGTVGLFRTRRSRS
ncbi:hypothetical protein AX769_05770 [Frondihabitans sp. PAMC 28766]|uniref:hypothetical protein n=1 Tax=Frondihabitans sp. PAMC 28766 TaxID=1795630 RepID=UPI00078CBD9B|nr:hypothetical protein [Frondihabitans sp. PAMC 28766]AMM19745.1 hypothetical protein AX769_05770 [Frondihabitans sp. PAMC 28766]